MRLQYEGFHQVDENTREFLFQAINARGNIRSILITVELLLFPKYNFGIQEGPLLCLRKLDTELESIASSQESCLHFALTEDDICALAVERENRAKRKSKKGGDRHSPSETKTSHVSSRL